MSGWPHRWGFGGTAWSEGTGRWCRLSRTQDTDCPHLLVPTTWQVARAKWQLALVPCMGRRK